MALRWGRVNFFSYAKVNSLITETNNCSGELNTNRDPGDLPSIIFYAGICEGYFTNCIGDVLGVIDKTKLAEPVILYKIYSAKNTNNKTTNQINSLLKIFFYCNVWMNG